MIFKNFIAGPFQANNYLLIDETTQKAVLIDCSGEVGDVIETLKEHNASLEKILLTHAHIDHIAGCYDLKEQTGAKIFVNEEDMFLIKNTQKQLQMFGLPPEKEAPVDGFIKDGETIHIGEIKIKAIHTPGHTKGGMCYLVEDKLFSGDTLFLGSVGRTDLPGGDYNELENSISNKIFTLEGDLDIYSGHGPKTTLEYEKKNNPFFGQNPIA
ncbi:MAG: MBL fold metallo-hydrolase [Candidatus Gastranaerophilales bacterium]|nr:MBL fold metallo-hydrolase [Candidatus Gastranaerophilales bacterium]